MRWPSRTLFVMVPLQDSLRRACVVLVVILTLDCGGQSIESDEARDAANAGSSQLDTATAGSGPGNAGGIGGGLGGAPNGSDPAVDECIEHYPNLDLKVCDTLEEYVSVHDPVIVDANGDGRASPGERITISVTLSEVSGSSHVPYPGIDFQTLGAGVSLDRVGFDGPMAYSLRACESAGAVVNATLSPTLKPGSSVRVIARAASLNQDCPNAAELIVPINVEAPAL